MSATADANLASLLTSTAAAHPARTALVAGGESVDYAELEARAARFAGVLRDAGVERGDRVAVMLPNSPAFVAAYHASLRLGAVAVPLNPLLKPREVADRLGNAQTRVLVDPAFVAAAGDAVPVETPATVRGGDTAVLLYTSGTTGGPKGAELTHAGLRTVATELAATLAVTADDVLFGAAPLSHVFGQAGVMNMAIAAGAGVALVERFDAAQALELIAAEHVTVFLGVPTMCLALLHAAEGRAEAPQLRVTHCGGAPMPVEVLRAFAERFGGEVLEGYGLTETAGTVTSHRLGRPVKPGSVGEPIPETEVRIADGDVGEVLVRGPGVMSGYWRDANATAQALSPDGWLATGDIGTIDDDGYLFLVDRKKDVILRGGYNVYPREVEEVLHEHDAVGQAVVVGVPDPLLGEEVVALVVPKANADCDAAALQAFVRERVAAYKYPRLVELVESLPQGPSGKILRREIDRAPLRRRLDELRG